ncbi:MAG: AMP-binding protein [Solirubrobacteraceae bacterium]
MLVESWLQRAAATRPEAPAVESSSGRYTHAELFASACAAAAQLQAGGVRAGDQVALALPAGVDFACALHATLLAGAIAVPIDLRLSRDERAEREAPAATVIDEPPAREPPVLAGPAGAPARAGFVHDLESPAVLIHTSGTSARPKPVLLTYGNLLWSAIGSAVAIGAAPADRWLCAMPLAHIGGLSILLRSAMCGSTAVVHERFEAERVLHCLKEEQITLVSLVATTLARLLDGGLQDPGHLRCALVGGGPVPGALLERAWRAGVPACQTFGLSEASSQVATASPFTAPARVPGGARPLFCTNVTIGPDGEILVAGPTVSEGAVAPDGWLHTGDLGELDECGALHVRGRAAETIVTGGENVAPAEVEEVLAQHPAVAEVAVVGRADERWGEAVTAIVVARAGDAPSAEQLRAHCAARLAPYKVPKIVELVGGPLPRTASGKLLRRELRDGWAAGGPPGGKALEGV